MKPVYQRIISLFVAILLILPTSMTVFASAGTVTFVVDENNLTKSATAQTANIGVKLTDTVNNFGGIQLLISADPSNPTGATLQAATSAIEGQKTNQAFSAGLSSNIQISADTAFVTWPVTIDANATGTWQYNITVVEMYDAATDDTFTITNPNFTATITVEEPAAADPYELYYTVNSTNDADVDGYKDFQIGDTVNVNVYLVSTTAQTLQAFDIYVTNDAKLVRTDADVSVTQGIMVTEGSTASNDSTTHIQAVGRQGNTGNVTAANSVAIALSANTPVLLATIPYTFAASTQYDEELDIAIVGGTAANKANIAIAGSGNQGEGTASIFPTVKTKDGVVGAEVVTSYLVTYDKNCGSDTVENMPDPSAMEYRTKYHNIPLTLSAAVPTRTGYTFEGWSETSGNNNTKDYDKGGSFTKNENKTLYAVWSQNTYTVNWYNMNNAPAEQLLETDTGVVHGTAPSYDGAEPQKASIAAKTYTFIGWNEDENATSATIAENLPNVTKNTDYYAIFSEADRAYTVTWLNQDGSPYGESQVIYNNKPSYPASPDPFEPTKAADAQYKYTFAGWASSANQESGDPLADLPVVTDNVTYYAAFSKTPVHYDVTLHENGGTINSGNVTGYDYNPDNAVTLPTDVTKTGYTFDGWYTEDNGNGTKVTEIPAGTTGNQEFWAKWTENTYTIVYHQNHSVSDTKINDSTTKLYTAPFKLSQYEALTFALPDVTYRFVEWNSQQEGHGTSFNTTDEYTVENNFISLATFANSRNEIHLYAKWTQDQFNIRYYEKLGDAAATAVTGAYEGNATKYPITYSQTGSDITLPEPAAKAGYTFKGWSGTGITAGQYPKTVNIVVSKNTMDLEYTANWDPAYVDVKVEHWLQNVDDDNYTRDDTRTQVLSDVYKTGETTAVTANTITGFTAVTPIQQEVVAADGSTVVRIDYNRNTFDVTWAYVDNTLDNPTFPEKPADQTGVKYGTQIADPAISLTGYVLTWDKTFPVTVDDDVTITGTWTAGTVNYTVKHMLQNADGTYTEAASETKTGLTGAQTAAAADAAYSADYIAQTITQVTITADGQAVVEVKYDRKTYAVTYVFDGVDAPAGQTEPAEVSYRWGEQVTVDTTARVVKGYTWGGWNITVPNPAPAISEGKFEMPKAAVTITGNWSLIGYTLTLNPNNGGANTTINYNVTESITLPLPTYGLYTFAGWKVTEADGDWAADSNYNDGTVAAGMTGNAKLTAQWNLNISIKIEDYKYAPKDFYMVRIANTLDSEKTYEYDGRTVYYYTDANYLNGLGDGVSSAFVVLVSKADLDITNLDDVKFTLAGGAKLTTKTADRATVTFDNNINGDDNGVNIADANTVYQMVIAGGAYYGDILSYERRLAADTVKNVGVNKDDKRGSIEDVNYIVNVVNGKAN